MLHLQSTLGIDLTSELSVKSPIGSKFGLTADELLAKGISIKPEPKAAPAKKAQPKVKKERKLKKAGDARSTRAEIREQVRRALPTRLAVYPSGT